MTYKENNNKSIIYYDVLWDVATLRFDIETFRFMSMRLKLSLALSRGMQPLYQVLTSDIVNFDKSRVVKLQHRIINKYEIKFSPKRWFTLPHEADLPNRA